MHISFYLMSADSFHRLKVECVYLNCVCVIAYLCSTVVQPLLYTAVASNLYCPVLEEKENFNYYNLLFQIYKVNTFTNL